MLYSWIKGTVIYCFYKYVIETIYLSKYIVAIYLSVCQIYISKQHTATPKFDFECVKIRIF